MTDREAAYLHDRLRALRMDAAAIWPGRVREVGYSENTHTAYVHLKRPVASIYGRGRSRSGAFHAMQSVHDACTQAVKP